ncbi:virB8 family protein [Burkholderia sp. TSV86]|uniref:virB8 family protein n=1 Tax=Burkholderia sp. TSV86 TaxID=1385594 RepID=UPI0009E7AFA2|nr:VirB8/TrbF family protein [Burkholderia sp. TSV86]
MQPKTPEPVRESLTMHHMTPEEEREYFARARTWDEDRVTKAEASEKRAWTVARWQWVVIVLIIVLAIVLAASRKVFPFLIIQHADGTTETTDLLANSQQTYQEALNQYFIRQAVQYRENYNYSQAQTLFNMAQLFNSPEQQKVYKAQSDPDNPESPSAKYSNRFDVTIDENSPPVTQDFNKHTGITIATYRWRQIVTPKDGSLPAKPVNWISTITYKYVGTPANAKVRSINPLGFQVLDYRRDPDQGGALQ